MKPSDTGPAPPQHSRLRSGRETAPRQSDLFAERGRVIPRRNPQPTAPPAPRPVEVLSDDELLALASEAGPSNVEAVCSELVSRSLGAAVPALEALWRRFAGFGVEKPLREQLAVLDTLARLGGTGARAVIRVLPTPCSTLCAISRAHGRRPSRAIWNAPSDARRPAASDATPGTGTCATRAARQAGLRYAPLT